MTKFFLNPFISLFTIPFEKAPILTVSDSYIYPQYNPHCTSDRKDSNTVIRYKSNKSWFIFPIDRNIYWTPMLIHASSPKNSINIKTNEKKKRAVWKEKNTSEHGCIAVMRQPTPRAKWSVVVKFLPRMHWDSDKQRDRTRGFSRPLAIRTVNPGFYLPGIEVYSILPVAWYTRTLR